MKYSLIFPAQTGHCKEGVQYSYVMWIHFDLQRVWIRSNANYFISPFSKLSFTLCVSLIYEPIVLFPGEEIMLLCNKTQLDLFQVWGRYCVYNARHKRVVMQFRMRQVSGCRKLLRNVINSFAVRNNMNLMFIGPCIIAIVDEWKTNLMSLAIFFSLIMCSTCFGH